jgi:type IV pilus assembly protein PilN
MIKVNLLGDSTVIDHSGRLWIAGYIASLVLLCGGCFFLNNYVAMQSYAIEDKNTDLETQLTKWKVVTKEVTELEAREKTLRQKLVVIATLRRNKSGPVRMLDSLNLALPEKSWIADLKEATGAVNITGRALDNQTIAKLMEEIDKSPYFSNVELAQSSQVLGQGLKLKEFNIAITVDYLGGMEAEAAAQQQAKASSGAAPQAIPAGAPLAAPLLGAADTVSDAANGSTGTASGALKTVRDKLN